MIGNLKTFLNGIFYGVTRKYLQEYVNEFCHWFNHCFREHELPMRLLNAYLSQIVQLKTEDCLEPLFFMNQFE